MLNMNDNYDNVASLIASGSSTPRYANTTIATIELDRVSVSSFLQKYA